MLVTDKPLVGIVSGRELQQQTQAVQTAYTPIAPTASIVAVA